MLLTLAFSLLAVALSFWLGWYSTSVTTTRPVYRFIPQPLAETPPQSNIDRIFADVTAQDIIAKSTLI